MNHLSSFVIFLVFFLGVLVGSYSIVRGLINVLFNKDYAQAHGLGDAIGSGIIDCPSNDYTSWSGDCSAGFGGDCGGGSAGGNCGS